MRKVIIIFLTLIISGNLYSQDRLFYREVISYNGVNVRKGPSTNTEIVATLQHGSLLEVLEYENFEVINGQDGHWLKIKVNEISGYVFSSFIGTTDLKSKFLYKVYLDQTTRTKSSDNYIFYPYTLDLLQVFKNYYVARFDVAIPKGQDGDNPMPNYAIYILENGKFREVFDRSYWGFEFITLLDINNDEIVDMVANYGGCCGQQQYIGVSIGNSLNQFPDTRAIRTAESSKDEYLYYCEEDFYFDGDLQKYVILGRKKFEDNNEGNYYRYYFDSQSKSFIKLE